MNTLTPAAPGRRSSSARSSTLSRVAPTIEGEVAMHAPAWPRATLSASASALAVGGLVFGISNTAVTPPKHRRPAAGCQVFLMLKPRLAEMDLAVDHAGQDMEARGVDGLAGSSRRSRRSRR